MRKLLHLLLAASLSGGLASMTASCGNEAPPMGGAVNNRDSLPVMVTHGVSKLISDSGFIRYKMIAEEWRVYDKTNPPRWEFPQGIFIERYDDKFKVNLYLTATTEVNGGAVMTTKIGDQEVRIGKKDYILKSEYVEFQGGTVVDVQWGE